MEVSYKWYTQNEDHPELNDCSTVTYTGSVLTVDCNDYAKSYKVKGPAPTQEDLHRVEDSYGDEPMCPDDPGYVLGLLGLSLAPST